MEVFISSTLQDLRGFRDVLANSLRKAKYGVVMMEEYVARDQLVEFACQGDVSACDAYVGIFAWRYGHVPEGHNPAHKSITELEYDAAEQRRIPRLLFLVRDGACWSHEVDADLTRIRELRQRLRKSCAAYFSDERELAVEVLAALRVLESSRLASKLDFIRDMRESQELGPSYLLNLKEKLLAIRDSPFIEIEIGGTAWWNTRLYLIAALAEEFGRTRGFVFVDPERRFLAMAAPGHIKSRLAQRWPQLAESYALFRRTAPDLYTIGERLWEYPISVQQTFGVEEKCAMQVVLAGDLQRSLGVIQDAEVVDTADKGQLFLVREILGRSTPYVALVRDKRLEGLIDRSELAVRISAALLG